MSGCQDRERVRTAEAVDDGPAGVDRIDQARYDEYRQVMAAPSLDCAGCAEWVRWRFASASTDPMLAQVIEAVWAGIVDWRYLHFDELPHHPYHRSHPQWQGPVRGPMQAAAGLLREAIDLIRRNTFAYPEAECLAYLTRYVLPDIKPFQKWQRTGHWSLPRGPQRKCWTTRSHRSGRPPWRCTTTHG
jgi:hypothetical protein